MERKEIIAGIEITPPNISEDTMEQMKAFFMKTSVPRILGEERKKTEKENEEDRTMISIKVDEQIIEERFLEEFKKRLDHIERSRTFWDTKELKHHTCMSWSTIQDTFFHDERFLKAKIGGKWYFPAKETEGFLLQWLKERSIR